MKRLSKILSIIILVMLTAFSIMQFHHHHCNGFAVSSVVEAIVEHEGCDDSDHHSSENDEHCGFHQDEAVEKRHILISSNEDNTLKGLGFAVLTNSLCCCYCYSNSIDFCEIIQRIPLADINVVSNRGPPSAIFNHIFCKTLFNQKFRKWQRNYYMVYSA